MTIRIHSLKSIFLMSALALLSACQDFPDENLNSPSLGSIYDNATLEELNNLVTGTESALRDSYDFYIDACGSIGREHYRFSNSEPRYVQELLGAGTLQPDPSGFYITNSWAARYRAIKNANILIGATHGSSYPSDAERNGYLSFAKTIQAYQYLLNLNLTDENGIRMDVDDPENLGPIVSKSEALEAISGLLNEARQLLSASETEFFFRLSDGFQGFDDPQGFLQFVNALAARVALYRENWSEAITYLEGSFLSHDQLDFHTGIYMTFSNANNDILNPLYFPRNATGESRVAHASYASEIEAGDDRILKTPLRDEVAVLADLSSDRDVQLYLTNTGDISIIRNEELILIYAEAHLHSGALQIAEDAINLVRMGHSLPAYAGESTMEDLLDELLRQRRYSLYFEGHRWIDMRRYGRLDQLPIDRPGDQVWEQLPIPFAEQG